MRLSTKLLLISEITLLAVAVALLIPLRSGMRAQVIEDLQNQLIAIAATAALGIDGRVHRHIRPGDDHAAQAFETVRDQLRRVRNANGLASDHLYTFTVTPPEAAGAPPGLRFAAMPHEGTPFTGESYPIKRHHLVALTHNTTAVSGLYHDQNGQWISAAAPIRDAAGHTVGLLEVTQPSAVYFARYQALVYWSNLLVALGLLLTSLLGYLVLTRLVINPVRQINRGMNALGQQDFAHRIKLKTGDEFQSLGESLNGLAEQFNTAKRIQAGFFPKALPSAAGYRMHGVSEPCDATGGDYYDVIELDHDRLAVVIADVTGHGLGPSLLMASCRSALRALAQTHLEPAELIEHLEDQLANDLTDGRFITMVFGVLHPCGRFVYANAGHAPAMLNTTQHGTRHLPSHRPPLGIRVPLDEPPQTVEQLEPGDRLLLASDGTIETQSPDQAFFGFAPLESLIKDPKLTCEQVVPRLHRQVVQHRGPHPSADDITILCIDRA